MVPGELLGCTALLLLRRPSRTSAAPRALCPLPCIQNYTAPLFSCSSASSTDPLCSSALDQPCENCISILLLFVFRLIYFSPIPCRVYLSQNVLYILIHIHMCFNLCLRCPKVASKPLRRAVQDRYRHFAVPNTDVRSAHLHPGYTFGVCVHTRRTCLHV